ELAARIATGGARRVGVFVNESAERIAEIARIAGLDTAQLHGDAIADYPAHIAIWKARQVTAVFKISPDTAANAEAMLLDGPAGELYGGAGRTFDWALARAAALRIVIAGGLDASNVAQAISIASPWGVDACSRLEAAPGKKDHAKMQAFIQVALQAAFQAAREAITL
ncbi:MAG: phosphoribosylanthranilate isomerase, partial [Bryobacteraceae bacterium]